MLNYQTSGWVSKHFPRQDDVCSISTLNKLSCENSAGILAVGRTGTEGYYWPLNLSYHNCETEATHTSYQWLRFGVSLRTDLLSSKNTGNYEAVSILTLRTYNCISVLAYARIFCHIRTRTSKKQWLYGLLPDSRVPTTAESHRRTFPKE